MKTANCKASGSDSRISQTEAEKREQARRNADEIYQRLITTASDTTGFPGEDTTQPALEQGMVLVEEFLKIKNQHVRGLIVQLVREMIDLTK